MVYCSNLESRSCKGGAICCGWEVILCDLTVGTFKQIASQWFYYHSEGSNKPDIQHSESAMFVLACKTVSGLWRQTMHSSKTTSTNWSHRDSLNIASACVTNDATAGEWRIVESLRRQTRWLFVSGCSATRDWLAPSLSNNETRSIFRWRSNNDAAFRIPSFESTLHQ